MERRLYFIAGDLLTNALAGAAAALAARGTISDVWNPVVAMPAGMLLGMFASLPVILVLMPFFGAFEVMLPAMLTGMIAGMVVGMLEAMDPLTIPKAALSGGGIGALVVVLVYVLTAHAGRKKFARSGNRA